MKKSTNVKLKCTAMTNERGKDPYKQTRTENYT